MYRVRCEMEFLENEVTSAKEAALEFLVFLRDPTNAAFFTVIEPSGNEVDIDFDENQQTEGRIA